MPNNQVQGKNPPMADDTGSEDAECEAGDLQEPALPEGVQIERYEDDGALAGTTRFRVGLKTGTSRDVEVLRDGDRYRWRVAHDELGVDNCPHSLESERSALVAAVRRIQEVEESVSGEDADRRWD